MKRKYTLIEQAKLAVAFDVHIVTIQRWIAKNDPRLTSDTAKKALRTP